MCVSLRPVDAEMVQEVSFRNDIYAGVEQTGGHPMTQIGAGKFLFVQVAAASDDLGFFLISP
jgi:hypothetical protein